MLIGKTGTGKTTLFKLLTGLYHQKYFPKQIIHQQSFSSQHPLLIPTASLLENIDPYSILGEVPE